MNPGTLRPRYAWRRFVQWRFQNQHPDAPWLTENAVYAFDQWLRPTDRGFEYGAGRSTLWFARHCAHVTSVEGHRAWYEKVKKMFADHGMDDRIDLHFVEAHPMDTEDDPNHPYARVIDKFEDESLDWVLVDGCLRGRCMEAAMPKLKPGGLLALDNANFYFPNEFEGYSRTPAMPRRQFKSPLWESLADRLADWRSIPNSDGIFETRFWIKPVG